MGDGLIMGEPAMEKQRATMEQAHVSRQKDVVVEVRASTGWVLESSLSSSGPAVIRVVTLQRPRREVRVVMKGETVQQEVLTLAQSGTFIL